MPRLRSVQTLLLVFLSACLFTAQGQTCPAGNSCDAGGGNVTPCTSGQFASANMFVCADCPLGHACPTTSAANPCNTGEYQDQTGQTSCETCPEGHMCPRPELAPIPCPIGSYTGSGQTSCSLCTAGKYCPEYASSITNCPTGSYSLDVATACTTCPVGHSCDSSRNSAPTVCSNDQFKAAEGPGACEACKAGTECLDRTALPTPCAFGFNSIDSDGICSNSLTANTENTELTSTTTRTCPAGTYFNWWSTPQMCSPCEPGQLCKSDFTMVACPAGWFNNANVCTACSAGKICPSLDAEFLCPAGYYQSHTGSIYCNQIPPGKTVADPADPIALQTCTAGQYFSDLGECQDCPVGFMCPDPKLRPVPCVPGEYADSTGSQTCQKCPAGKYCKTTTGTPVDVDPDFYAPEGSINQLSCPPGWECSTSAVLNPICQWGQYHDGASCVNCPAGKLCTQIKNHTPLDCPNGTYSKQSWMLCIPCPPGYTCTADGATITACELGQYTFESELTCTDGRTNYITPIKVSSVNSPCPPGSYQDATSRRSTCLPCPFNHNCAVTSKINLVTSYSNFVTPVACGTGSYAQAGDGFCMDNQAGTDGTDICLPGTYSDADNCDPCPEGHYCADPALLPIPCPPGSYQDTQGQIKCKECAAGTECLFGATVNNPCPPGYHCPVSWRPKIICPPGYSSAPASSVCSPCPNNKYCPYAGSVSGSEADCPQNMYCSTPWDGALPVYNLCPAGTYSNTGTAAVVTDCQQCTIGNYCEETLSTRLQPCPQGHYCPPGTEYSTQYPCPDGTYNAGTSGQSSGDCLQCSAGNYCHEGSIQDGPACPFGATCGVQANNAVADTWCPMGTYSDEQNGRSTPCAACPAGHYCPYGSAVAIPCPPGTYQTGGGASYRSECLPCDAGTACRTIGSTSAAGDACANGHYCPAGTESPYQFPCPYGTWSNGGTGFTQISQCVSCPVGKACGLATHTADEQFPCPPGYYCPAGTTWPYANPCPAGKYNPGVDATSDAACVNCPQGYFCPPGTAEPNERCPPGYYCESGTKYRHQFPCTAGSYQPKWGQTSNAACVTCPAGFYCPLGTDYPYPCMRGHFCPSGTELPETSPTPNGSPAFNSRSAASIAAAGKYSPRKGDAELDCPDGTYSEAGSGRCLTCPKGFRCEAGNTNALNLVISSMACPAGDWCAEGSGTTVVECPLGSYCDEGTHYPQQCPAGTHADVPATGKISRNNCSDTKEGFWTPPGSIAEESYPCEPGHYCPVASKVPDAVRCPAGEYLPTTGGERFSQCVNCGKGFYCPEGSAHRIPCGDGHYCDEEQLSEPKDCPPGTYSSVDSAQDAACTPCDIGQSCTHYGLSKPDFLCAAGFLCTAGSIETSLASMICTAGGYCELGTKVKESCRPSTYNPDTGKSYLLDCQYCPPGFYCAGDNGSSPTAQCSEGYFCTGQSFTPTQEVTLPGYFTLAEATEMQECPARQYQDLFAQNSCKTCEAGFYCNTVANDGTARVVCPAGHYCQADSQSPEKCPVGKFSYKLGLTAETECLSCLPGYYCPTSGIKEKGEMSLCSAGYYCKEAAFIGTPETDPTGASRYGPCPPGHFCPSGTAEPIPCPPGTYSSAEGLQTEGSCTQCTAGKYCPTSGLTAATLDCDAGYFCPAGEKVPRREANKCDAGFYCPSGSPAKLPCATGDFQKNTRQALCERCPNGYTCESSQVDPTACEAGKFCESGNVNLCAAGKYNPSTFATASSQCAVCPPGKICTTEGLAQYTDPTNCPEGFYCSPLGDKTAGDKTAQCVAGYHCAENSALPIDCPGGHYCDGTATVQKCLAGYYCTARATKSNPTTAAEGGGICPAGHYCPLGSDSPIACPPGTYNPATAGENDGACLPCPAGKFCLNAGETSSSGSCTAGYKCAAAVRSTPTPAADKCSADHYCDGGASEIACATDREYQPNTGQSACLTCPSGFRCSSSGFTDCNADHQSYCDQNYAIQACVSGSYAPSVNAAASSECVQITAGYRFSVPGGVFTQTKCTAGKFCEEGSATESTCPEGFYCPEGSATPIKCDAGKYCQGTDNITNDGNCDGGYYCTEGATVSNPTDGTTGNRCPKGHYCEPGSSAPVACPIGTYSGTFQNTSSGDCQPCDAGRYCDALGLESPGVQCFEGYYCDPSSTSPNPREHSCPPGYKCPTGSTDKVACLAGEYQPLPLKGKCEACPERFYCPSTATSMALICPKGKYCPEGTSVPNDCLAGTYNDRYGLKSQNECSPCPVGHYCELAGTTEITTANQCDPGYYCVGSSTNKQQFACPEGYYCLAGTFNPLPCPIGTYAATGSSALTQPGDCQACPAGYYCSLKAATQTQVLSDTYKCAAGYLCTGGAINPTPTDEATEGGRYCGTGKFCPRGATVQEDCPKGTYNPYQGQETCITCPAGRLCNSLGMDAFINCPAGKFCEQGDTDPQDCPAGTYSPMENLESASQCLECDPGKYCVGGQSTTTGDCDAGFSCPRGASVKDLNAVFSFSPLTGGRCPPGHYCEPGNELPTQCPEGKYNSNDGQIDVNGCLDCPAGYYCDELGLVTAYKRCSAGFFCIGGSTLPKPIDGVKGRACAKGHYCPQGTTTEQQCLGGTYEPREGSEACQTCPAGFECAVGSIDPSPCPANKFCTQNQESGAFCPDGTYSLTTGLELSSQCTACPTGKYCQNGVIVDDCDAGYFCHTGGDAANPTNMQCPRGHYCLKGSTAPTICPDGKVNDSLGGVDENACVACQTGYYCIQAQAYICPAGHYCDGNNSGGVLDPKECPEDTYNPDEGKGSSADCLPCPAGNYCNDKAIADLDFYKCPKGKYCPDGATTGDLVPAIDCPSGYYNDRRGLGADTECTQCPGGSYCAAGSIFPLKCKAGYYCPAGSSVGVLCEPGFYCPYESPDHVQCPQAYYCPTQGLHTYVKCPSGNYCPAGASAPTPCPVGSYAANNPLNINESSECLTCEQGTYVSAAGTTECLPCTPGYTCEGGTLSATPTDLATQNGEICPAGFYCPQGSWDPIPCPKGTYQPNTGEFASSACLVAAQGYFVDTEGAIEQKNCGSNAFNQAAGLISCKCYGKHREFQPEKSTCMCASGYEPVGNDDVGDSPNDCQPIVCPICTGSTVQNDKCQCVAPDDCAAQCTEAIGGRIIYNVGLCECSQVVDSDSFCDSTCRSNKPQYRLDHKNNLIATYSDGTAATVGQTTITGLFGSPTCPDSCKVYPIHFSSTFFSGNYDMVSEVATYVDGQPRSLGERVLQPAAIAFPPARGLQSSTEIINPIVCIKEGETVVFQINYDAVGGLHEYPIYDRNSLLNTQTSFDYSAFTQLAGQLAAGNPISSFAFTFIDPGTYAFTNSLDSSKRLVVAVKDQAVACPSPDAYLLPTSYQNLLSVGIKLQENLVYEPDWLLIGMILFAFVMLAVITILLVLYYKKKQWRLASVPHIPYRRAQQSVEFEEVEAKLKTLFKQGQGESESSRLSSSGSSADSEELRERERKKLRGERYAIEEGKLDEMLGKAERLQLGFLGTDERDEDLQRIIQLRINTLIEKLRRIREGEEAEEVALQREQEAREAEEAKEARKREEERQREQRRMEREQERQLNKMDADKRAFMEKMLRTGDERQRAFLERLEASTLSQEQRDALMQDFLNNAERVNGILEEEERRQQEDLQRKLDERKEKRLRLRARIEQLEKERDGKASELKEGLEDLNDETAAQLNQLNDQLEKEGEDLLAQTRAKIERQRQEKRQAFQQRLGRQKKGEDVQSLISDYEEDSHALERKLQLELDAQKRNVARALAERKERHRLQVENERREREKALLAEKQEAVKALDQEIARLKRIAENEGLNEKIENLVDAKSRQENVRVEKLRDAGDEELDGLARKHQAEMDQLETATVSTDMQDDMDRQRELIQLEEEESKEGLEARRDELRRQLEGCDDEAERARLMAELAAQQEALMLRLQKEQDAQKRTLGDKLAARRMKKLKRKQALQEQQVAEKRELRAKQEVEEDKMKQELGARDLAQIIRDIQQNVEPPERPYAIQKAVDEKQARDLSELLMRQFQEKARALQDAMVRLMEQKMEELKILTDQFRAKAEAVEAQRDSLGDQETERRLKALREEEHERRQDLEDKYLEKQATEENEITRRLLGKHTDQMLELKQRQNLEKQQIIREFVPSAARGLFADDPDQLAQELDRFRRELEQRKEKELNALAERERLLKEQRDRFHERMERMDQFGQHLSSYQPFDKKKGKRFGMEDTALQAAQKKLIEGYKQRNEQMDKLLNTEQARQKGMLEDKLSKKKAMRQQFRQKRLQELEEAKRREQEQPRVQLENSVFKEVLLKHVSAETVFDKVKGAYKGEEAKKKRDHNLRVSQQQKTGLLSPARSLTGSPMRTGFGPKRTPLISGIQSPGPKQAILADDEILAKLMLKLQNIEEKVFRIDKQQH